ncbi:ARS binding protein 2-domain-containing protein [Dichotomopilus funicola]|uniref:ARS binding protein 2-domain-containing protein n=1 Tax=Dichotomopilus funicola TaxID=1934379 RepID=A0AAN6ZKN2_9PEZI|nr:ARS binding protein 2-domain-containing protein [Dichotomopilus funicola]
MAAMKQHAPQTVFTASPTTIRPNGAHAPSATRILPERNVTGASIEDAYVAFILYCNPGVPLETDSATLRDAFRTPPKSGGKSFSTHTLFELIKKLETRELKTWAELALKLGVEPPDQEKGQSSQKIQQYAVRLKRWMHSMHVDAFFEYLIGRPSPYWTEIPSEHTPISELERDGVAAEDDMALRALLPHIKPRRGRRKPEEDDTGKSPSQRPSPQADELGAGGQANTAEPWTAQPDVRGSVFLFPPVPDPSRLNPSAPTWSNDIVQTPMSAYPLPQSAITPSVRNGFWADEPRSAITPSKAKSASRRHGAKVVSSAWRSGGIGSTGKTRGRPPINRGTNADGPFSAFPASDGPIFRFPSPTPPEKAPLPTPNNSHNNNSSNNNDPAACPSYNDVPVSQPASRASAAGTTEVPPISPTCQSRPAHNANHFSPVQESAPARPAKRRMLSLQVPERKGGEVRLATPPLAEPATAPVVMVNGLAPEPYGQVAPEPLGVSQASSVLAQIPGMIPGATPPDMPIAPPPSGPHLTFSDDPTDRTHLPEIEAVFVSRLLDAEWYDENHNPMPACSLDEAVAFSQTVIETLVKAAATKEAFLINLAGLAGGSILMPKGSLRVTRLEALPDRTRYRSAWYLKYGGIVGNWSMEETVLHEKWKKKGEENGINGEGEDEGPQTKEDWERKYKDLLATLHKREHENIRFQTKIIETGRKG